MFRCCFCAADGALRIDISVHERDLENMAKGKRLFSGSKGNKRDRKKKNSVAGDINYHQKLFLF